MKALVTGGAGFIGSHVVDRLVAAGHEVKVIDDLSVGKREHIARGVELWQLDLGTVPAAELARRVEAYAPEIAFHLAAIHFIPYCIAHPEQTFATNVRATHTLVQALEKCAVRKLVSASTMDVYPVADKVHSETDEPDPRNIYGLTKLLSEQIVRCAAYCHDSMAAVSLRLANVYGPRETNPHVIPDFFKLLAKQDLPEIKMGYLGASRDFVHVFDVADAFVAAAAADTGKYAFFNVGTGVATPLRTMLDLIRRAVGDGRAIKEDPQKFRKFDRPSLTPDVRKIKAAIGWKAKLVPQQGVETLVEEHAH
jgi:UDP-glucose 4-epimerase